MELATVERPPTTTISTIAVRAEPHTTIVIAMLKSLGDIELRIDEMKPKLLEIGATLEETEHFLNAHNDLTTRLASKQEQVEELLTRADQLVTEQKDVNDIYVYEAMADGLGVAWKDLNRQLELRGYILSDTQRFYQLADQHNKVSRMSHETTHKTLFKIQPNYLSLLTDTFNACAGGAQQPDRLINIAYIFLNVTQTKEAVMQLFGTSKEMTMLSSFISNPAAITSFKCVIAKTLVNVSIFQGMHLFMLKDQFLADVLYPFADEDDELSTEEMEKLPLQLQYVDHKRSQCTTLLTDLINLLSQLTITTSLRKKMRDLGIYAILREYDKSRRDKSLPLVEDKFMTLEGTVEWKVLMHTLIFDDEELQVGDLSSRMPDKITDFDMDELAAEIRLIENGDK